MASLSKSVHQILVTPDQDDQLIFRYDNAPHHQKLNISTFPHHKHEQQENNIVSSDVPFLEEVCQEIKQIIKQKYGISG